MVTSGQLLGFAWRLLAVLLVLSSCAGTNLAAPGTPTSAQPVVERTVAPPSPVLLDTDGVSLRAEHADVVRAVHRALSTGDLDALGELYAGDDWAGQSVMLADDAVRRAVLDVLGTQPVNLGEGYVYPGFSVEPDTEYHGYLTAFLLDYDPPRVEEGPLRWRGIAIVADMSTA